MISITYKHDHNPGKDQLQTSVKDKMIWTINVQTCTYLTTLKLITRLTGVTHAHNSQKAADGLVN